MKKYLKSNLKIFIGFICGIAVCLYFVSAYASTYNSEEISYDTSTSGAVQANVKDALDFLYNKTKSGASSECPENMSCVEKPGVVMSVTGPGIVNKGTVYVGLDDSATFIVTPNEGYVLASISCDNGYTLGSFKTLSTEAMSSQEITITNPGTTTGATCNVKFSTNEISVSSTNLHSTYNSDKCNTENPGCICYYINKYVTGYRSSSDRGQSFNYNGHTGCKFKSTSCYYTYTRYNSGTFNCDTIYFYGVDLAWSNQSALNDLEFYSKMIKKPVVTGFFWWYVPCVIFNILKFF